MMVSDLEFTLIDVLLLLIPVFHILTALFALVFVGTLSVFHARLMMLGRTTNEHLKGVFKKSLAPNVDNRGYFRNLF